MQKKRGLFLAFSAYGTLCNLNKTAIFPDCFVGWRLADEINLPDNEHNPLPSKVFFLLAWLTAPYATTTKQPIFSGCFVGWRLADEISLPDNEHNPLPSKAFFLLVWFTAPYAASRKQPIFSSCFLEWRLAATEQKPSLSG
ncbi:MAG: hypothetical protein NTY00_06660 [Deltaproteobacteria bacterium]|nr:hypothetical protein [Deltaproteobacteria bacterium]